MPKHDEVTSHVILNIVEANAESMKRCAVQVFTFPAVKAVIMYKW